ncbi:MAG: hypothetical protein K8T20_08795 [Planctomycetes bacterium]|nr:hypothetical protein [Planctomycetota bacterium]
MKTLRILAFVLVTLPALAHHGGGGTSTGGGQLTMAPDGLLSGKFEAELRVDWAAFHHLSDQRLNDAAAKGHMLHGVREDITYAVDASFGIIDQIMVGLTIPYHQTIDFREGDEDYMLGDPPVDLKDVNIRGFADVPVFVHITILRGAFKLGVRLGVEVPVGEWNQHAADGAYLETSHQPGSGSWDGFGGVAAGYGMDIWEINAALTGQINTKGVRDFKIGQHYRGSIGGSIVLTPKSFPVKISPTLDLALDWHGRDYEHGKGIEDASGFESFVAPGVRVVVGPVFAQLASPIQLTNRIPEHPNQKIRFVFSVGVTF